MVTIIVDTKEEYDEMMLHSQKYVCGQMPYFKCAEYGNSLCSECFDDNHIKYGIRIIPPVDNAKSSEL